MRVATAVAGMFALLGVAGPTSVGPDTGVVQSGEEMPAPALSRQRVFLSVPHIRQERNLCVPTAAAMVLSYFGDAREPRELKVLSRGRAYDPDAPFDDFTRTWWRDLNTGLRTLGYRWHETLYPDDTAGFYEGLEAIRVSLQRELPVLVDVALYGSHTFLIVGYDDERETVFINDPNVPSPGLRILSYRQLESIWNGRSYDLHARPALFVERKRERQRRH